MPQLSLYLDEQTLKRVQEAARLSDTSVSKWVAGQLKARLHHEWPGGYFDLFGSVQDDAFKRPAAPRVRDDVTRESL